MGVRGEVARRLATTWRPSTSGMARSVITMSYGMRVANAARNDIDSCLAAIRGGDLVAFIDQRAAQRFDQ